MLTTYQICSAAESRDTPFYVEGIDYDPSIPTPESVIGHPLGHRIARNDLLVQYMARW